MIYQLENRVADLEYQCSQLNTNIGSLQTIVDALRNNDYITSVTPIYQEKDVIGYTISFAKSKPITIYNGKDGEDGKDGDPVGIGLKKDIDGNYYWTINGEWLLGEDGQKVKASGKDGRMPLLRIEDGYWFMSTDDGQNWTRLGPAVGGDSAFFKNVEIDKDYVYLTFADGTTISIPRNPESRGGQMEIVKLTIDSKDWAYSFADNNNFFYVSFDMPEITEDVFDNGLIKMYRTYNYDSYDATQMEMPYVRLNEWYDSYDDAWYNYTETVDYEYGIGKITVFYTASDFNYEIDETFVPEAMTFRCVIFK